MAVFQALIVACAIASSDCVMLKTEDLATPQECQILIEERVDSIDTNKVVILFQGCREIKEGQKT